MPEAVVPGFLQVKLGKAARAVVEMIRRCRCSLAGIGALEVERQECCGTAGLRSKSLLHTLFY